jgi:pyridoxine 5-phosphate synthase
MTKLSVNVNKVALLRNSRGRNFPSVMQFAQRCLDLGAHGITLHPRPDQRHSLYRDVEELIPLVCQQFGGELNVEGYPTDELLAVVKRVRPTQCTLVPDAPGQLTSDHGWNLPTNERWLRSVIAELKGCGIRVSLFMDYDNTAIELARELGADRIELYTEPYAESFGTANETAMVDAFAAAARRAQKSDLGVNAGHDLSLTNLQRFLTIPDILEVSIGHALIAESIEYGIEFVIGGYLQIIAGNKSCETAQKSVRQFSTDPTDFSRHASASHTKG